MRILHDDGARAEIIERMQSLRPDSRRRWGRMTVDQMLWHVNQGLLASLGQLQTEPARMPFPALARPLALRLPWPRGARTAPEWRALSEHDFERERKRYLLLVGDFTRRSLGESFGLHPLFGSMTGRDWSRMHYKHADHHLRQFSV